MAVEKEEVKQIEEGNRVSEEFTGFVSAALRGRKHGIYQQLLAGLLLKANKTNDASVKIASICEAAYLSKKKDKLNMEMVEAAYAVCKSFLNTEADKNVVRVAWSFPETEENWKTS